MRNNKSARFHHTTALRRPVVLLEQALKHAIGHTDGVTEHEDDGIFFFLRAINVRGTFRKEDLGNRKRDVSQTISDIRCPLHRSLVNCDSGCVCAAAPPNHCQLQMGSLGFQWCSAQVAREDHLRTWFAANVAITALQHTEAPWHATGTVVP